MPDKDLVQLLQRTGDPDKAVAHAAQDELAKALALPLREAILVGDIVSGIYQANFLNGQSPEYPLDLINPGEEDDFTAYANPGNGRIPERQVEGDYVMIPTYSIANSIDFLLKYARDARWDIVERALQVMASGFRKKMNDDGWHTVIGAGVDRNILVYDADASGGQFTKRLISLMKVVMRRNGGGNSGSTTRSKLTDVFLSPEALEDIRNWGVDQVDDQTRREIYVSDEGVSRIFGVTLHELDEFGVGQDYQNFYTNELGGSMPSGDTEIVIGLDLQPAKSAFIMPVREDISIFADPELHRRQKQGYYGWYEGGFACLDGRNVVIGSL